jgi:hypothetical protein
MTFKRLKRLLTSAKICAMIPVDKAPKEIKELYPESKGFIICPVGEEIDEAFKKESTVLDGLAIWGAK